MKNLVAGQKAKAKAGLHSFDAGQEIEFIAIVNNKEFGYDDSEGVIYDFKGEVYGDEINQHLIEEEFEIIS